MMDYDCDRGSEESLREQLHMSPEAAQLFLGQASEGASRVLLERLPNEGWCTFLLNQLGVSQPSSETSSSTVTERTYDCSHLGGTVLVRVDMLTDYTTVVVQRNASATPAETVAA